MSCKKNVCPEGLSVCCGDCIRKELEACEGYCERAKDPKTCINYWDETQERKKRKLERKTDRRMMRWVIGLVIAILAILGFTLWQTYKTAAYIAEIEKEPLAATERLQNPVPTGNTTTYSIADSEVLSND